MFYPKQVDISWIAPGALLGERMKSKPNYFNSIIRRSSVRTKNPYGSKGKPLDPIRLAQSKRRISKAMKEEVKEFNRKQNAQRSQ